MRGYLDLHCDTLTFAMGKGYRSISRIPGAMADVERLKKAGVKAQFFAVFFPPNLSETDENFFLSARKILFDTIRKNPDEIAFAGSGEDLKRNLSQNKLSAFLTLEDGRAVDEKVENLFRFYSQGVRLITLTWNQPNCFGFPNSRDEKIMSKGLTEFGIQAVGEMNRLGMIIDVSHLSDGGFYDVAKHSKYPFVASHSNCRALTPHPRNLTDEMIRILAEHGGVAGVNLAPPFVRGEEGSKKSSVSRVADHAMHLFHTGGEDLPAIGSDFDGVEGDLEIAEPGKMELLFEELKKRGLSERQLEKIACGNAERVIESVL